MAHEEESRPDPLAQGKGRSDEVDQSKGIFPPGVPHPAGAEIRPPGSLGGGPYDESGRGGVEIPVGQSTSGASLEDREPATGEGGGEAEASEGEQPEGAEPKGALPAPERRVA